MLDKSGSARLADLCFALDVMEEHSHLGLDDETAIRIRAILVRQIDDARADLSPLHIPFATKAYA